MKKLFIVGGDGFAREVYYQIKIHPKFKKDFEFGGFLGHAGYGHTVNYKNVQKYYKGELADYHFNENDYCLIGAGHPHIRKKIYNDLKTINAKIDNFIAGPCIIDESVILGEGNIFINSAISVNVQFGNGNLLNGDIIIGHDCIIGDFNFFGPRSQILGSVKMGNENSIGANSILLPLSKIGSNNKVSPLSVVYKGCKDNAYYLGNPAIKIGTI